MSAFLASLFTFEVKCLILFRKDSEIDSEGPSLKGVLGFTVTSLLYILQYT